MKEMKERDGSRLKCNLLQNEIISCDDFYFYLQYYVVCVVFTVIISILLLLYLNYLLSQYYDLIIFR